MRRVVITGIGAVSPLGHTATETWENAKKGVNGIDEITLFPLTEDFSVKFAGEVKNFNPEAVLDPKEAKRMARFTQFGMTSAIEAYNDAKLTNASLDHNRVGVFFTSGIGSLEGIADSTLRGHEKGWSKISPFFIPSTIINICAGQIAIALNCKGSVYSPVTACASATDAIGQAFRSIKDGYHDVILAGGSEAAITDIGIAGFMCMRALNRSEDRNRASIPFDRERSGFVMGEGGACLVIEELEHAKKRGAKIYAEVVGYGSTCDAHHITAPVENGEGATRCMQMALKDVSLDTVDYINAHGTSTPLNDKTETRAIKNVFGEDTKVSISSTKSMVGHMLGASGAIEAMFITKAIEDGFVPPTINYKEADEDCNLDITPNVGKSKNIRVAISNSLGFGGHNATIAFRKFEG